MARGTMRSDDELRAAPDDYVIERDDERRGTPLVTLLVQAVRFLLMVALAVLSLALFWLVATMLGLF